MTRYPSRLHFLIRRIQQILARPVLREIEANLDSRAIRSRDSPDLLRISVVSLHEEYYKGLTSAFQTSRDIVRAYLSPTGVRIQPEISKRGSERS